ncbi:MAG TPA: hypothetical protein PKE69_13630 [Pyrinomonadaceae bacterium]|nr:hypothetical protein [Pyrinomonadaceae bacterium]
MKLPNTQPKISFNENENPRNREIISQALEIHETKIKRFVNISLAKMGILHSTEFQTKLSKWLRFAHSAEQVQPN